MNETKVSNLPGKAQATNLTMTATIYLNKWKKHQVSILIDIVA